MLTHLLQLRALLLKLYHDSQLFPPNLTPSQSTLANHYQTLQHDLTTSPRPIPLTTSNLLNQIAALHSFIYTNYFHTPISQHFHRRYLTHHLLPDIEQEAALAAFRAILFFDPTRHTNLSPSRHATLAIYYARHSAKGYVTRWLQQQKKGAFSKTPLQLLVPSRDYGDDGVTPSSIIDPPCEEISQNTVDHQQTLHTLIHTLQTTLDSLPPSQKDVLTAYTNFLLNPHPKDSRAQSYSHPSPVKATALHLNVSKSYVQNVLRNVRTLLLRRHPDFVELINA